jgi:hypothetical protein
LQEVLACLSCEWHATTTSGGAPGDLVLIEEVFVFIPHASPQEPQVHSVAELTNAVLGQEPGSIMVRVHLFFIVIVYLLFLNIVERCVLCSCILLVLRFV